jgi:hypothetical protein
MWPMFEREPTKRWQASEDFVYLWGEFGCVKVSHVVGAWVARVTTRPVRPRWLEFVDKSGALVRVRSRHVWLIRDSSNDVRARSRTHDKMMETEEGW